MGYRISPDGSNSPDAPNLQVDAFMEVETPGRDQPDSVGGGVELRLLW